jgi:1,4-dihydroxy-2-naphthoate octaprenyltransferase
MLSRSTWLHLRVPFSYFLLPVYIFALGFSHDEQIVQTVISFLIIHLLLYPASNGFNSYFDKDEKSIGGLKTPPPVKKELYFTSLIMDGAAVILSFVFTNLTFSVMVLLYGIISKMYSHPSVRLKKYALIGWVITGLFQGLFSFFMCFTGINQTGPETFLSKELLLAGVLTSIMLWGNYPMTQIYQHEEDEKHGDNTLSRMLGIRGTFYFVQIVFSIAAAGFVIYFNTFFTIRYSYVFLAALFPVVLFFMTWFYKVWKDETKADFENTMKLNLISATCLNLFFLYFWWANSQHS